MIYRMQYKKADVQVEVETKKGEFVELKSISIPELGDITKLVLMNDVLLKDIKQAYYEDQRKRGKYVR